MKNSSGNSSNYYDNYSSYHPYYDASFTNRYWYETSSGDGQFDKTNYGLAPNMMPPQSMVMPQGQGEYGPYISEALRKIYYKDSSSWTRELQRRHGKRSSLSSSPAPSLSASPLKPLMPPHQQHQPPHQQPHQQHQSPHQPPHQQHQPPHHQPQHQQHQSPYQQHQSPYQQHQSPYQQHLSPYQQHLSQHQQPQSQHQPPHHQPQHQQHQSPHQQHQSPYQQHQSPYQQHQSSYQQHLSQHQQPQSPHQQHQPPHQQHQPSHQQHEPPLQQRQPPLQQRQPALQPPHQQQQQQHQQQNQLQHGRSNQPAVSQGQHPQVVTPPFSTADYDVIKDNYVDVGPTGGEKGGGPSKRGRRLYTFGQLKQLEKEFHNNNYVCHSRRFEMAALLNLSEKQIRAWFKNRRAKFRKQMKSKEYSCRPISNLPASCGSVAQDMSPPNFPRNMNKQDVLVGQQQHTHQRHMGQYMRDMDHELSTLNPSNRIQELPTMAP